MIAKSMWFTSGEVGVALLLAVVLAPWALAAVPSEGCFYDVAATGPVYRFSGGRISGLDPQMCQIQCLKQGITTGTNSTLTMGITGGDICLCGLDFDISNLVNAGNSCLKLCPDGSACGGGSGEISAYVSDALSAEGLTAVIQNQLGEDMAGKVIPLGEPIFTTLLMGEFNCSSTAQLNIGCKNANETKAPVEIVIDYGDGSGTVEWNRQDDHDLWTHMYTRTGTFNIFIKTTNIFSRYTESVTLTVQVEEPLTVPSTTVPSTTDPGHQIEIICPDVVDPGSVFLCEADIPRGTNLSARFTIIDDISLTSQSTNWIPVPDYWYDIPGSPTSYASYNMNVNESSTTTNFSSNGFVLRSTYFKSVSNISFIEFVPLSAGVIVFEAVKPQCSSGLVWCSLTQDCRSTCLAKLGIHSSTDALYTCSVGDFCSNEETCSTSLACPAISGSPPIAYQTVAPITTIDVSELMVGTKQIYRVPRSVEMDPAIAGDAYVGFKTRAEVQHTGDRFLAIRCGDPLNCAALAYRPTTMSRNSDLKANYAGSIYEAPAEIDAKIAAGVFLFEDRLMPVREKFFCDKATEKTVRLEVKDTFNAVVTKETLKVSCQYPILQIDDLSSNHTANVNENSWEVITPFPTQQQIEVHNYPKEYVANLMVRNGEEITFHVHFGAGSHVQVEWHIEYPIVNDSCHAMLNPTSNSPPVDEGTVFSDTADPTKTCVFPFRYKKVLYYGCANVTLSGILYKICATEVDSDYNAKVISWCNDNCPLQYPRAAEVEGSTIQQTVYNYSEAEGTSYVYSQEYVLPIETDLELKRTFTEPGVEYRVVLTATNMHNSNDSAKMTWNVLCGNPVISDDWFLTHDSFIYTGNVFSVILTTKPNVSLPTWPTLKIFEVMGDQRIDHEHIIDYYSDVEFYVDDGSAPPDCSLGDLRCRRELVLSDVGFGDNIISGPNGEISTQLGIDLTISIPSFSARGSHGFAIEFFNVISTVKINDNDRTIANESIKLLDPAPSGSGEWVTVNRTKWDYHWVEVYDPLEPPVDFEFAYSIPNEYGSEQFPLEFVDGKWYMPALAYPQFNVSFYIGSVRRIQYTFNSTEAFGTSLPPCMKDWPVKAFGGQHKWTIGHCGNITEGTYTVVVSVWNPLDGWISSNPNTIEVIERVGPININDFQLVTDHYESKPFEISLERAGSQTCVVIDYGDYSSQEFFGNLESCRIRYSSLNETDVQPFDLNTRTISVSHIYNRRSQYYVRVYGFDARNYAEASLAVTVFKLSCNHPSVWIADNYTDFARTSAIPKIQKSKGFVKQALSDLVCNISTPTYKTWRAYSVKVVPEPSSFSGYKEELTEIPINGSIPSSNTSLLDVPPLVFDYGIIKLVYRLEIETFDPDVPLYREAYTYINVIKSDLQAILIEGSVAKVSRGWGQSIILNPGELSMDPDEPENKNFNYTYWCRVVSPIEESFKEYDAEGYPVFDPNNTQAIPPPGSAHLINPPPGCFGIGPGALRAYTGVFSMDTASFITYAQVYEIMLVLSKDTRRARVKIEIDMISVPAPIGTIECASLCYPTFGGVFVNPTSRLALRGDCIEECNGEESYMWELLRADDDYITDPLKTTYCESVVGTTTTIAPATTTPTTTTTLTTTMPLITEQVESLVFTTNTEKIVTSGDIELGTSVPVSTTIQDSTTVRKRRRKREISTKILPDSCYYTFADGQRDARDGKELSVQQKFFDIQNPVIKKFVLLLNITNDVYDGRKWITAHGTSYLNVFINDPPAGGYCTIDIKTKDANGNLVWEPAETGRALLDEFDIKCRNWKDPNQHRITKYVFKITENTDGGEVTTILHSGPSSETKVVLPVGEFRLFVEIHEEAEAFAIYEIDPKFPTYLPTQDEYESMDIQAEIDKYNLIGDQSRISQILQSDASIKATACWFDYRCLLESQNGDLLLDPENMTETQAKELNDLIRLITLSNTESIEAARDSLHYTTIDQLAQGATTLAAITNDITGDDLLSNTLDMNGRDAAVEMISKMSDGFKTIENPDPQKLDTFITGVTGSVMSIMESLNKILYANDPEELPLTDFEAAADLPYDTDIPDENADIPDNVEDAFKMNAMKLTRISAVEQVKKMINLVDNIAETSIVNMVEGEEMRTKAPLGVQMIMSKLGGSATIGRDTNGDGIPDRKLRYEFEDSNTVVQFPLGFCPGAPETGFIRFKNCNGRWGFVIKEWETITATYPFSARNLNRVTKQVDIDLYNDRGGRVDVTGMKVNIEIIIERMKAKNPEAVSFAESDMTQVDVKKRLNSLERRKKIPLIYHYLNITSTYATINVQIKVDNYKDTRLVLLARNEKLPILKNCDFVRNVKNVTSMDSGYVDMFFDTSFVKNRTGKWFFGVISIKEDVDIDSVIKDGAPCSESTISENMLSKDFKTQKYTFRAYTGGCYYFNKSTEIWEGVGQTVYNYSTLETGCGTDHLTSFGSGFHPVVNTIDFDFVFAHASFEDNMTIYMCLIITFTIYFILMIWAFFKDRKDVQELVVPVLADNHPDDKYFYEVLVETGPLASHATKSNISFILTGEDDNTGARCFTDPDREIFKSGALDSFLMATEAPLGELKYLRIWTDSSGHGDMGAWYLLSITVTDIQTGEKFRFVADQWLAVDRGTYEDDINVHGFPADSEEDKYFLMKAAGARSLLDEHRWCSVFSRPIRSRFTRCQRVTVCMAMLYLFFLGDAMFYNTSAERVSNPLWEMGPLKFDFQDMVVGLIINLITFPPGLIAAYLFKNSKPMKTRTNRFDLGLEKAKEQGKFNEPGTGHRRSVTEEERKRNKSLSSFFTYLAWGICIVSIVGGAIIVLSFGLSFGNNVTYQWMVSMISSFFTSLVFTQPLKIVLIALVISFILKKPIFNDDHVEVDEEPPLVYWNPDDENERRPKRQKAEKRKMDPLFYEDMVKVKNQEMEMRTVLRDMMIYFAYISIILIISYGNRDPNAYLEKSALEQAIIFGGSNCDILPNDDPRYKPCKIGELPIKYINFNNIRDVNEWYGWLDLTLIPNVRVQPWYNGKPPYGLRGYLNDRVNRIIGYAIVRQVREELGACRTAKVVRDAIESCTGDGGMSTEDDRDYCMGWVPLTNYNCTKAEEFEYVTAGELKSFTTNAEIRKYGGGGYILKLRGYIDDLKDRIELLKREHWVNNQTRALIVEFSVYNAQVNIFSTITCTAEFVGGGVNPHYRIEVFRLFPNLDFFGVIVRVAEILFVGSIFYYTVNVASLLKKEGCRLFFKNTYNLFDFVTVILSYLALIMYIAKAIVTSQVTADISETRGNQYIRLTYVSLLNQTYEYLVAITVFTSTIKFSRLLSFQKAFMQIAATIRLCFEGLASFIVEFLIVFGAFCSFFFFVLKNDLDNFRDYPRTVENTMAMSIGKFNFGALRAADEMAAWIFFVFSIVVNMILINMMMAIINLAFEEIKENASNYQNKFELMEYIKRQCREVVGLSIAKPIVPVYVDEDHEIKDEDDKELDETDKTSQEFSDKTNMLLKYIESTYGEGMDDEESSRMMAKLKAAAGDEKKAMEYGFDALFMSDKDKTE